MERLLFYRSHFLEAWTKFLSRGFAREVLAASQAA